MERPTKKAKISKSSEEPVQHDEETSQQELHTSFQPLVDVMSKRCPASAMTMTERERQQWATDVLLALQAKYGITPTSNSTTNAAKAASSKLRSHARSILYNVKKHPQLVTQHEPSRLARLSLEELGQGSAAQRSRETALLGGWEPPPPAPRQLPASSPWRDHDNPLEIILFFKDANGQQAYAQYFDPLPRVTVVLESNIGRLVADHGVDALVSPANTMGNMDGGIDRVYADYFGWSHGKPYHEPNPLQLAMMEQSEEQSMSLEIGQAILVLDGASDVDKSKDENNKSQRNTHHQCTCLIAAPTMAVPGKIKVGSRIVHDAARAAFALWREHSNEIGKIAMPSFGTGWGQVPAEVAAFQVYEAFCSVWKSR